MEPANLQRCQHVTNKISTKRYKKVCLNIFKMIQTFWNDYQNCNFSVNSVHQTFLSATFTTSSKSYKYIGIANLGKSVIKGLIHSFSIYSNKTVACILLLGKLLFGRVEFWTLHNIHRAAACPWCWEPGSENVMEVTKQA